MPPLSRGLRAHTKLSFTLSRRHFGSRNDFFKVSEEVQDALHSGKPVVALETTIYTHGIVLLPSTMRTA
jgi:pseudouridylate synthase / pseudouridine kinase